MWNREQVKGNAKYVLSFSYWKALVACLIVTFVTGISQMGSGYSAIFRLSDNYYFSWRFGVILLLVFSVLALLGSLFGIFVVNPIEVGKCRFFIANRQNKGGYDQIFSIFKSGIYLNIVKTMFLKNLYIFLWSLLFIIPGIIKAYEYSMVPYILAENPQMDSNRVFALSRSMTDGEKGDIFVFDLSFLGWILLGTLACGIGTVFVAPYIQAAYAELYEVLKYKVISQRLADMNELGGPEGYTGEAQRPPYPYAPMGYAQPQNGAPAYPAKNTSFSTQSPAQPPAAKESWYEQQLKNEQERPLQDSDEDGSK